MRSLMIYLLSLSLISAPCAWGGADSLAARGEVLNKVKDLAFLRALRERVGLYLSMNASYLEQLAKCSVQISNESSRGLRAPVTEYEGSACDPSYREKFEVIKENIRADHPRLRRDMLLYGLLKDDAFINGLSLLFRDAYYTVILKNRHQLSRKLKIRPYLKDNPLNSMFVRDSQLPYVPYTGLEIEDAFGDRPIIPYGRIADTIEKPKDANPNGASFVGDMGSITPFEGNIKGLHKFICKKTLGKEPDGDSVCESLQLKYDSQEEAVYFIKSNAGAKSLKPLSVGSVPCDLWCRYTYASREVRETQAQKWKDRLYEDIVLHPYVALAESSAPSDLEIAKIITTMAQNARSTKTKFKEEYSSDEVGQDNYDHATTSDLLPLVVEYELIATQFVAEREEAGDPEVRATYERLVAKKRKRDLMVNGSLLVGVIALNIAICWAGGAIARTERVAVLLSQGGRLGETLKSAAMPVCFALSSATINGYFLYDSISIYNRVFEYLFTFSNKMTDEGLERYKTSSENYETGSVVSPDRDVEPLLGQAGDKSDPYQNLLLKEVESLDEARSQVLWSVIFAPVGTGVTGGLVKGVDWGMNKLGLSRLLQNRVESLLRAKAENPELIHGQ